MGDRFTAMFHLYVKEPGPGGRTLDERPFIGTNEEAFEELKEEIKTLFPDDFDRQDREFWRKRRIELGLSLDAETRITCRDIKGARTIIMKRTTGFKREGEE